MRKNSASRTFFSTCFIWLLARLPDSRTKTVPAGDAWLYEPKLDRYRLQVVRRAARFGSLQSPRQRMDGALARPGRRAGGHSMPIGGDRCRAVPAVGAPNFYGLPAAMRHGRNHELVVYAFDLLHRDGRDLRALPLTERRRRLEWLLAKSRVPWSIGAAPARADGPATCGGCGARLSIGVGNVRAPSGTDDHEPSPPRAGGLRPPARSVASIVTPSVQLPEETRPKFAVA
jgi:hypothetical protein